MDIGVIDDVPNYTPEFRAAWRGRATFFTLIVQVNGRVRANIEVPTDISEADAIKKAKEHENVQKYMKGKTVRKEMYVPEKLVSLVV